MKPFALSCRLQDYYPLPRDILQKNIPATAMLLYAVLLDRATLSQKNSWTDETGRVYVIYPKEKLAETLGSSLSTVKRQLNALEAAGLITRDRPSGFCASRIFVNVPKMTAEEVKCEPASVQDRTPSNLNNNLTYQHCEDESL